MPIKKNSKLYRDILKARRSLKSEHFLTEEDVFGKPKEYHYPLLCNNPRCVSPMEFRVIEHGHWEQQYLPRYCPFCGKQTLSCKKCGKPNYTCDCSWVGDQVLKKKLKRIRQ